MAVRSAVGRTGARCALHSYRVCRNLIIPSQARKRLSLMSAAHRAGAVAATEQVLAVCRNMPFQMSTAARADRGFGSRRKGGSDGSLQVVECVFRPIVTAHSEKGVTGDSEVVTGDSDLIVTDSGRRRNHRSRCRNRRSRSNRNGLCGQRGNHPCHGYPRALCAERRDAGGADCHAQHQGAVTAQVRLRALA